MSTKQQFRMHASRQSGTRTGGGRQLVLHFFVLAYRHPALTTKPTLAPLLKTFNGIDQTHRTCFKKEWCPKGFSEHPFQGSSTGASHGYSTTSTADHSSVKPAYENGCSLECRSRFSSCISCLRAGRTESSRKAFASQKRFACPTSSPSALQLSRLRRTERLGQRRKEKGVSCACRPAAWFKSLERGSPCRCRKVWLFRDWGQCATVVRRRRGPD